MTDWQEFYLSELGKLSRGKSKYRPRWAPHLYGGKYPFIQTGEIAASDKYITTFENTYSELGLAQSKLWPKNTLCITIAANIAEVAILKFPSCFPDSVLGFIPDADKCDLDFIFYTFKHFRNQIKKLAIGSVQDNINLGTFSLIKFKIPRLHEQKRISYILSIIDDKIDLLWRQNETLEQMAQALFKHWFLDFEFPNEEGKSYKSSGGRMKPSELDDIPEGWRVGKFLDEFDLLSGGTPETSLEEYWGGNIKWISAKDITQNHRGFILSTEKKITEEGLKNSATKLLPKFTSIISARGTVGNFCIMAENMCISQSNYGIRSKKPERDFFTYLSISKLMKRLKSQSYGTVFDTITGYTFRSLSIIIPSYEVIERFEKLISPIFLKILTNSKMIINLTKIRDALQPKLMSGQIRVGK